MSDFEPIKDVAVGGASAGGAFYALRWLVNYFTGRVDQRQKQLDAEHASLDIGWKEYRLGLERRMQTMERQNRALRLSFEHVAGALIRKDPDNAALAIADRIMAQAFPDDFSMTVTRIDGAASSVG